MTKAIQRDNERGFHNIPIRKKGDSPTGQSSGWLFLFYNEEVF